MALGRVHIVGFGSQGSAWAQCLRASGYDVQVLLLRKSASFEKATSLGFEPRFQPDFSEGSNWVVMLCPDSEIPTVYRDLFAKLTSELHLVLAHGFAVYSEELKLHQPNHHLHLLAPKAIGPKILENFQKAHPQPHTLVAAYFSEAGTAPQLKELARGLGFHPGNLVPATFEQETVGDLISEQGLLCGGIFNLLTWTVEAMRKAGIPERLIHEECVTELELIAGLIRERGPLGTFQAISQAAQCGTVDMRQVFEKVGFPQEFLKQTESISSGRFAQTFRSSEWRAQAKALATKLGEIK